MPATLCFKQADSLKNILLTEDYPSYAKGDIDENILYEEMPCPQENFCLQTDLPVQKAELYINSVLIGTFTKEHEQLKFMYSDSGRQQSKQLPFLLNYGFVLINIEAVLDDNNCISLFSRYCLVVSKSEDNNQNIKEILNAIDNFTDGVLNDWLFDKSQRFKNDKYSLIFGEWRKKSYKSFRSYIRMIEEITAVYIEHFAFFKSNACHSIKVIREIMPYQKVRKISGQDFRWLMQNAENLVENRQTGIQYNNKLYFPYKLLGSRQQKNRNIYENNVIVSFLAQLSKDCTLIKNGLQEKNTNLNIILNKITEKLNDEYSSSIATIKLFQINYIKYAINKLALLENKLNGLLAQYHQIFPDQIFKLTHFPRRTKIFQEIKQYKEIYEAIIRWSSFGEYSLEKENVLFNVKTLDTLFEYYCLLQLLALFLNQGWKWKTEAASFFHTYNLPAKYKEETCLCNTYCFEKDGCSLTLYYQPVIYGNAFANDISLFRTSLNTTGHESFFTPDFVIKVQLPHEERYAIFDAKYSTRKNIKEYLLPEIMQKYMCQIADKNSISSIKMLCALQGRIDQENSIYKLQNSAFTASWYQGPDISVVSLNTQSDLNGFWDIFKQYMLK